MRKQRINVEELRQMYAIVELCFYVIGVQDRTLNETSRLTKLSITTIRNLLHKKTKYIRFVTIQKLLKAADLTFQEVGGNNIYS